MSSAKQGLEHRFYEGPDIQENDASKFPDRSLMLDFLEAQLDPRVPTKEWGGAVVEMIGRYDEELFLRCLNVLKVQAEGTDYEVVMLNSDQHLNMT